ncbi:tetratricopeptide repeat protein [Nocardia bovistercoris]|uniref:XRE family transcriptional regulator n=1 Tax=Nocardia bovistercoris TaxID=2785916 RepID=A0A931I6N4_9NOCA|nr:hypothetical protein [Nocardia bovistercoris]MBH0775066.1 hypothetical protein [Nocardia bovistercoris]
MAEHNVTNKGLARRMKEYSERDGGSLLKPTHTTIARYLSGATERPSERSCAVMVAVLSSLTGRTLTSDDLGYPDEKFSIGTESTSGGDLAFDLVLLPPAPVDAIAPEFVQHLGNILAEHVRMDALTGPRYVLGSLRAQLALVEELCGKARGAIRPALLDVGARFCEFAGWLFQDSGDLRAALYWSNRAMDYAEELGDAQLTAYVLQRRSNIATESGYAAQGLGLANAALRRSAELAPDVRAVALRQRAHAYSLTGETDECRRALDEAMVATLSIDAGNVNGLAAYCTPSYIEMEAAQSWARIGRPDLAAETYASGLADWPATQRRDRGLCVARLASVHATLGNHDEAGQLGVEATQLVRIAPSARSLAVLRDVGRVLAFNAGPAVVEFKSAMHAFGESGQSA